MALFYMPADPRRWRSRPAPHVQARNAPAGEFFLAREGLAPPIVQRLPPRRLELVASHSRLAERGAVGRRARRPKSKAWEQSLYEKGFWRARRPSPSVGREPRTRPLVNSSTNSREQLDRQKDHDAGDWPTGEFTGGKHDRHDSADDLKA